MVEASAWPTRVAQDATACSQAREPFLKPSPVSARIPAATVSGTPPFFIAVIN